MIESDTCRISRMPSSSVADISCTSPSASLARGKPVEVLSFVVCRCDPLRRIIRDALAAIVLSLADDRTILEPSKFVHGAPASITKTARARGVGFERVAELTAMPALVLDGGHCAFREKESRWGRSLEHRTRVTICAQGYKKNLHWATSEKNGH